MLRVECSSVLNQAFASWAVRQRDLGEWKRTSLPADGWIWRDVHKVDVANGLRRQVQDQEDQAGLDGKDRPLFHRNV
jgi:hypothetical protein